MKAGLFILLSRREPRMQYYIHIALSRLGGAQAEIYRRSWSVSRQTVKKSRKFHCSSMALHEIWFSRARAFKRCESTAKTARGIIFLKNRLKCHYTLILAKSTLIGLASVSVDFAALNLRQESIRSVIRNVLKDLRNSGWNALNSQSDFSRFYPRCINCETNFTTAVWFPDAILRFCWWKWRS